jgi:hypothetical protein
MVARGISPFEPIMPVLDGLLRFVTDIERFQLLQWHAEFAVHPLDGYILLAERRLRSRHPDDSYRFVFFQR